MEKRRRSASGQEAREQFITKRAKSVELGGSWTFMDSVESGKSYSRSTSCQSNASNKSNNGLDDDNNSRPELRQSDTVAMTSTFPELRHSDTQDITSILPNRQQTDTLDIIPSNIQPQHADTVATTSIIPEVKHSETAEMTSIIPGLQTSGTAEMTSIIPGLQTSGTTEMTSIIPGLQTSGTSEMTSIIPECQRSDTVDMASTSWDLYRDRSTHRNSFATDDIDSNRSQLLKQLSSDILNADTVDGPCDHDDDVCRVLAYMQLVPPEVRTDIASYLSSGSLEQVQLTMENIHHFFHMAQHLNLKQLTDSCMRFCRDVNQATVLSAFEGCDCYDDIEMESSTGYYRSQSVVSNPDITEPPQYYVVFSKEAAIDSKVKSKVKVNVIDMNERRNVYHKEVEKMRHFGDGFACCSCEVKGTPFVFVSGGEGSANLVRKYDIILGRWEKCCKLIHGRSNHMMVTSEKGSIFVLGGTEVPCIEEYDTKSNKWTERASLATHVVSAVCIYSRNKIYVFGGRTVAGPVANVQCYDTETHRVTLLPDLPCPFEGGQVVTLNDCFYIATDQGHMMCYNPINGTSYLCTQQPVQRKHFGMFVKYGRIYLVGGMLCNQDDTSRTVPQYRYNAEKDLYVEKYKLCQTFPVYSNCIINYDKKCCVIPFNESF